MYNSVRSVKSEKLKGSVESRIKIILQIVLKTSELVIKYESRTKSKSEGNLHRWSIHNFPEFAEIFFSLSKLYTKKKS